MRSVLAGLILVLAGYCGYWPVARAEEIRIGGTGVGLALMRIIAESYQAQNPGDTIWIPESVGTAGAIKGVAASKLDIGIILRPLRDGEVAGGVAEELCRTPLVFFAHASRSDLALTRENLSALYEGRLARFPFGEVRALLRPSTDMGFTRLVEYFQELAPIVLAARETRGTNLALTDQDAMEMVEKSRSLISFGALLPLMAERRKLAVIPLNGIMPSLDAMAAGTYPYWTPVFLATGSAPAPAATRFLEYTRSAVTDSLLRANGCLPAMGHGKK